MHAASHHGASSLSLLLLLSHKRGPFETGLCLAALKCGVDGFLHSFLVDVVLMMLEE